MFKRYQVAVYEGGLASGGPEEGGWWYWAGQIVGKPRARFTKRGAWKLARRLRERFPEGSDRTSVLPRDDDYEVIVGDKGEQLGEFYPAMRPRYE